MKKLLFFFGLLVITINLTSQNGFSQVDIEELFENMTPFEKCGQMTQITLDVVAIGIDNVRELEEKIPIVEKTLVEFLDTYKIGSILNTGAFGTYTVTSLSARMWQKMISFIHDCTFNKTSLKIPIVYAIDSIHGANYISEGTLFPQPINQAATFNRKIVEQIGRMTAIEQRAVGIPWNFMPVLDVARQPLWSRFYECLGESPYVVSVLGEEYVKGSQGDGNLANNDNVAVCLKHFIGYSFPFNGKDKTPVIMDEKDMREIFLPPFEKAMDQNPSTVMLSAAEVSGVPCHSNPYYVNEILKKELKFKGVVVSDWLEVIKLHTIHKVASTPKEAVRIAVLSGVDMSMVPYDSSFTTYCSELYNEDNEFERRVNESTLKILNFKKDIGLLDADTVYPREEDLKNIGTDETYNFNLKAARESIILAKNSESNGLPLSNDPSKKVCVIGPSGNLRKVLNGGWSYTWLGEKEDYYDLGGNGHKILTIYQAVKQKTDNVLYRDGVKFVYDGGKLYTVFNDFNETIDEAKTCDHILLTIGEDTYAEQFGNIDSLELDSVQKILANELFKLNVPVTVIYVAGRPRVMNEIIDKANAVLLAFLPGIRGAEAIADIVFGDYNPDGKLPVTYPKVTNGFITHDFKYIEKFEHYKPENYIKFEFGHGLSYTTFEYSNLRLCSNEYDMREDEEIRVYVDVKNNGTRPGKETVILYIYDEYASVTRPVKQVRGFEKIYLEPNDIQTVEFVLNINKDLSLINIHNRRVVEPGNFIVYVGELSKRFHLK